LKTAFASLRVQSRSGSMRHLGADCSKARARPSL
jgi:hypothetical protein